MKSYRWSRCLTPFTLNLGSRWRCGVNFTTPPPFYPQERTPLPTEQEAVWATEPVWTFWIRKKYLTLPAFEPQPVQH